MPKRTFEISKGQTTLESFYKKIPKTPPRPTPTSTRKMAPRTRGRRVAAVAVKLREQQGDDVQTPADEIDDEMSPSLISELKKKKQANPKWYNRYGEKKCRTLKPGTWRRILNQNGKRPGCLFYDTSGPTKRNETLKFDFELIAASTKEPTAVDYDVECLLCKKKYGTWVKDIRRTKHRLLHINFKTNFAGYMETSAKAGFSVHVLCLDYAYGENMIQNLEADDQDERLDGYKIDNIVKAAERKFKCVYCQGSRAYVACAAKLCRSKT